ncbi:hypothetical protein CcaverHIS002_0503680 [Cutaneotrichosporon cavernicola]|uniref:OPA3-domain-containing protein n=1 Tax=Cutaneotrichosporon cavernicola TaxID=279322 RepID=A0AA48L6F6_9TREE|nr:uncharacterized protein CcaverHIS019_0504250 [Cutaneotrichosporon cavernicola]BEI84967.1 hypothetical protein CcaverHIS002_0503680 [Cutaneotrichosporon cavernicola]BEI92797.1 hypothetical protein CcaverHIS019_0504250 [Cutaneotrichosporon cavernicola]BEJ00573.1 hypothetical protein CcaverHIS631_0504300 [Cutaneotrichosporon cavernicola]BEJ08341.1 hypothetical protein CcaverHIS641_0504260 [Cutaneotrichosporon cavernicola]
MASIKIFSLAVKTLAKPIAATIKQQAVTHERFRRICINFAQAMHRTEARMRMGLLNEEARNIKPLNEAKAVQNGASMMAETFLFALGASLVLGETYRSSRKNVKRRDLVAERLEDLEEAVEKLNEHAAQDVQHLQERSDALEKALKTVVANGLRAGWLGLGHNDTEVQRLISELPGQPFALRNRDGTEADDGVETVGVEESVVEQVSSARPLADPPVDHETPTPPKVKPT